MGRFKLGSGETTWDAAGAEVHAESLAYPAGTRVGSLGNTVECGDREILHTWLGLWKAASEVLQSAAQDKPQHALNPLWKKSGQHRGQE